MEGQTVLKNPWKILPALAVAAVVMAGCSSGASSAKDNNNPAAFYANDTTTSTTGSSDTASPVANAYYADLSPQVFATLRSGLADQSTDSVNEWAWSLGALQGCGTGSVDEEWQAMVSTLNTGGTNNVDLTPDEAQNIINAAQSAGVCNT